MAVPMVEDAAATYQAALDAIATVDSTLADVTARAAAAETSAQDAALRAGNASQDAHLAQTAATDSATSAGNAASSAADALSVVNDCFDSAVAAQDSAAAAAQSAASAASDAMAVAREYLRWTTHGMTYAKSGQIGAAIQIPIASLAEGVFLDLYFPTETNYAYYGVVHDTRIIPFALMTTPSAYWTIDAGGTKTHTDTYVNRITIDGTPTTFSVGVKVTIDSTNSFLSAEFVAGGTMPAVNAYIYAYSR